MGIFFIKGIISGNHYQPCIFSLSSHVRLFSPCPEGCVVIMLVSVCECVTVCLCFVCMCGVKMQHNQKAVGGKIRATDTAT